MKELEFNGIRVVHHTNRRQKNSYIHIKHDHILLKTPSISINDAYRLLAQKEAWIEKKFFEQSQRELMNFTLGEEVYFLGQRHPIVDNPLFDDLHTAITSLKSRADENMQRCYELFYKQRAYDLLADKLNCFEQSMQLNAKQMKIRKMKRRWGSCSSHGVITFNSLLVQLPEHLVDYVVVHELAHLLEMNHSKSFYAVVGQTLPDYKQRQKEMKKYLLDL